MRRNPDQPNPQRLQQADAALAGVTILVSQHTRAEEAAAQDEVIDRIAHFLPSKAYDCLLGLRNPPSKRALLHAVSHQSGMNCPPIVDEFIMRQPIPVMISIRDRLNAMLKHGPVGLNGLAVLLKARLHYSYPRKQIKKQPCPCGSGKKYSQCCRQLIEGEVEPEDL